MEQLDKLLIEFAKLVLQVESLQQRISRVKEAIFNEEQKVRSQRVSPESPGPVPE